MKHRGRYVQGWNELSWRQRVRRWWLTVRLVAARGELGCGCHRHSEYGTVVAAWCRRHV